MQGKELFKNVNSNKNKNVQLRILWLLKLSNINIEPASKIRFWLLYTDWQQNSTKSTQTWLFKQTLGGFKSSLAHIDWKQPLLATISD